MLDCLTINLQFSNEVHFLSLPRDSHLHPKPAPKNHHSLKGTAYITTTLVPSITWMESFSYLGLHSDYHHSKYPCSRGIFWGGNNGLMHCSRVWRQTLTSKCRDKELKEGNLIRMLYPNCRVIALFLKRSGPDARRAQVKHVKVCKE